MTEQHSTHKPTACGAGTPREGRLRSPSVLAALVGFAVIASWLGWLGWHTLDGSGSYTGTRIVGLVLTVAVTMAAAVRCGLRPHATVNAATVAMVAISWTDISTTSGDGNLFLASLILFGSPLYVLALTVALLVEAQAQQRHPPAPVPSPYDPGPQDPEQQVAAWRAYRNRDIGPD